MWCDRFQERSMRVGMWEKSKSFLLSFKAKIGFQSTEEGDVTAAGAQMCFAPTSIWRRKSGLLMRKLKVGLHQAGQYQNKCFCLPKMYCSGWPAWSTIYYLSALWHCVCTVDRYRRVCICQPVSCSPPHIIYHPRPSPSYSFFGININWNCHCLFTLLINFALPQRLGGQWIYQNNDQYPFTFCLFIAITGLRI